MRPLQLCGTCFTMKGVKCRKLWPPNMLICFFSPFHTLKKNMVVHLIRTRTSVYIIYLCCTYLYERSQGTCAVTKTLVICCILGIILANYIGIIISHYKDPYQQTSIIECHKGFERCSPENDSMEDQILENPHFPYFFDAYYTLSAIDGYRPGFVRSLCLRNWRT